MSEENNLLQVGALPGVTQGFKVYPVSFIPYESLPPRHKALSVPPCNGGTLPHPIIHVFAKPTTVCGKQGAQGSPCRHPRVIWRFPQHPACALRTLLLAEGFHCVWPFPLSRGLLLQGSTPSASPFPRTSPWPTLSTASRGYPGHGTASREGWQARQDPEGGGDPAAP